MKTKYSLINFLKNSFSFFINLFEYRLMSWSNIGCKIENSFLDKGVLINENYALKECSIGYGTYISKNSNISFSSIGKFCSIGPNFICGWGIHPTNGISTSPAFYSVKKQNGFTYTTSNKVEERKQISIGNDVFIGANVMVLDGITIGDGAVIGAGTIVSKNIPPYAIAVGSPVQVIKYRFKDDVINQLMKIQWWNQNEEVLRKVEANFFDVENFITEMNN